jgi:hypothetical protein
MPIIATAQPAAPAENNDLFGAPMYDYIKSKLDIIEKFIKEKSAGINIKEHDDYKTDVKVLLSIKENIQQIN